MENDLKKQIEESVKKAQGHLSYSFNKIKTLKLEEIEGADEELLETLESFSSRFSRLSDIVISKYLRFLTYEADPGFRGTVIDTLNLAEKQGWIDSAKNWRRIRELRNVAAHEYTSEEYAKLYSELIGLAPILLKFKVS